MASVEDYTIGCICALSIEAVALRAFLDEEHTCPELPSTHAATQDRNVYTTGSIGGHKIVVGTLPFGRYGVSQATGVIENMIRSFPNLRCCLMVGIGGGAPSSKHDIRLGDVVVSAAFGRSGGILQYDHGKATQGEPVRINQHLNEPPTILLSAIGKLVQDFELDQHPLQNMIDEVLTKRPRLKATYQRPDDSSDRLYKSTVKHPTDTPGNCEQVCGNGLSKLTERVARAAGAGVSEIHYGIIASGSSLMKDATVRDRLSEQEEVLCFEMEAAGLMNRFPCLVIRGICDYSDSHKNDDWQKYAAMMAAAYTKEVLHVLMPGTVKGTVNRLNERLGDIGSSVQIIATRQQDMHVSETRKRLLDWLPFKDYSGRHNASQDDIQEGTGQWFLNTAVFHTWLQQKGAILFCPGIPGAGKTHIASLVIHHLQRLHPFESTPGLAYIYCEYTYQPDRETLLGSLLEQLVQTLRPLPAEVLVLYERHRNDRGKSFVKDLGIVLRDVVATFERCFIVLDGLDECTDDEGMRTFLLEALFELQQTGIVNLMVTSRHIQHIEDFFDARDCLKIKITAQDHDLGLYLDHRIPIVLQLLAGDLNLIQKIKAVLMAVADGMFLLTMLHVNSLKGKVNAKAVEDALAEVESGGSSLIKAYDKTMRMIQRQDEGYRTLAKHTLSWLAFSDEPLTTSQLQHALAIEPGKTDLDFNNVTNLEIILSTCAGLVTVQENYNACSTVHMVHKTTQEYFLETRLEWFGDVRARLARLSLTYLTFQTFGTGPYRADLASRQEKYPLWIYLSRYFSRYIEGKSDSEDARVKSMLGKFFLGDAYVVAHVQARPELFDTNNWKYPSLRSTFNSLETWRPHLFARRGFAEGSTALHLAIFYRFGSLIPMLIHKGANKTDSYGLTPLHLAVVLKFYEGIQYLLSAPEVDCNVAAPGREWTALLHACKEGDERSVRLLLACEKTDCNLPDEHGVTPLMWALSYRRSEVVRLLLGREDVEFISPDEDGLLPLHHAALGGSTDCIRELLGKHNLGVNLRDSKGRTPLAWCMEHSCSQATLQLISRNDVVIRWPIKTGQIRLAWIMEALLVRFRSEISAKDNNHRTVLDHAAQHGHWDIVQQLLVRCKPKLCIECSFEDTALFFAARGGPPEVVELLVSQIELKDSSWFMRALVLSMESKTLECFAIMEKKLQGWMQCHPEWMEACLIRAAEKGRDNVLASILQRLRHDISGIDVGEVHFLDDQFSWDNVTIPEIVFDIPSTQLNVRDKLGQTALHAMARHQNIAATRILLIMGAETDARDDDGCTAVECASHWPEDLEWLRERMLPS